MSRLLRENRFSMEDVQNATLAGGVAVGSTCTMELGPGYVPSPACHVAGRSSIGPRQAGSALRHGARAGVVVQRLLCIA